MLSYARAIELFEYNPDTGIILWKKATSNRVKIGDEVGSVMTNKHGLSYLQTSVDRNRLQVHRLAWLLHYGFFPSETIDHEDGNGLNNRIKNLRDVSDLENKRNGRRKSTNTSGITGVTWNKKAKKWLAQIQVHNVACYLGLFSDIEAAVKARKLASETANFHKNHGRD